MLQKHLAMFGSFFLVIALLLTGCSQDEESTSLTLEQRKKIYQQEGIKHLLEKILTKSDFQDFGYLFNAQQAELFKKKLKDSDNQNRALTFYNYLKESLRTGRFRLVQNEIRSPSFQLSNIKPEKNVSFQQLFALAQIYQVPCFRFRTREGCSFPLNENSKLRRAFRRLKIIYENRKNLSNRWLLNQLAIGLGNFPEMLDKNIEIPSLKSTSSEQSLVRDIGRSARVDRWSHAGSVAIADFTGNGKSDLITSSMRLNESLNLHENLRGETVFKRKSGTNLNGQTGGMNITQADYNNDGTMDLFVPRGSGLGEAGRIPNSLLKNKGGGKFVDTTKKAGLLSFSPTQAAGWADYNGDGYLDLIVGNQNIPSDTSYVRLYQNQGDGTFKDVTIESGILFSAYIEGVTWGDVNNDGFPDLYITTTRGRNKLYLNQGGTTPDSRFFVDITKEAGVSGPIHSSTTWFWDYNNDGLQDLFVGGFLKPEREAAAAAAAYHLGMDTGAVKPSIYRNEGDLKFTNVASKLGIDTGYYVRGANFGDINNDGYPDFFLGTGTPPLGDLVPNHLFINQRGQSFRKVSRGKGIGSLGKTQGAGFSDFDHDGDQEIYAVQGGPYQADSAPNLYYDNLSKTGKWVNIKLIGTETNRNAIGAQIKTTLINSNGDTRSIYQTVNSGGSFGNSSFRVHIGLGTSKRIKKVRVKWPVGTPKTQVLSNLKQNRFYRLKQGNKPIHLNRDE